MIDPRAGIEHFHVEDRKLSDYLLNINHPRGGSKAARLLRHNFTHGLLRNLLAEHGASGVMLSARETPYGSVFEVVDALPTPLNTYLSVRSVWEVRSASPTIARLITLTFED